MNFRSARSDRTQRWTILRSLLIAPLVYGCASVPPQQALPGQAQIPLSASDAIEEGRPLAVGDVVAIEFPHRADLNQEVTLRADGQISLPLIGTARAAGLTPQDLEMELRNQYARFAYNPMTATAEKHYLINVDDVLDVRFRFAANLNATVQVRPDGRISLELVKSVIAEGKTPEQLEAELIQRYAEFLQSPDLVVIVAKFTSELVSVNGQLMRPGLKNLEDPVVVVRSYAPRQVYVAGEVRNPGFITYRPPLTAVQAIISSGGPLNSAERSRVVLLRKTGVETPTATFLDLENDLKGRASNDVPLRAYDILVVPKTRIASIDQFLDQYVYQLLPAVRNVNFTFFYELGGRRVVNAPVAAPGDQR